MDDDEDDNDGDETRLTNLFAVCLSRRGKTGPKHDTKDGPKLTWCSFLFRVS